VQVADRAAEVLRRERPVHDVVPAPQRLELLRRLVQPADQLGPQGHRTRRGSKGGRPVSYDRELYTQRNVVEGSFALLKQWRGLATRYDKQALIYRGAVVLAAVLAWNRT
jgi:transposase